MTRTAHYFYLAIGFIVVLALACGGGDGGADSQGADIAAIQEADLAAMTLSLEDLDAEFAHLEMDPDSGFSDNEDAAADSIDPADTADDFARLRRVGGYSLTYVDPDLAALDTGEGVVSLSMELDLFEDSDGASQFFSKQRDDFQRMEGALLENGVLLEQTQTFPVDSVGEEAAGLYVRASYNDAKLYQTVVAFRLDRLVAATVLFRADSADASSQVQGMAGDLAERIEEVSLAAASVSRQSEPTGDQPDPESLGGTADGNLVGEWRVYSETLFFDAGGSGGSDSSASTTRMLVLKDDGTWEFGSSSGSWYVTSIDPSDWDRWETASYGPERKIVLEGWNGDVGDGPVEEYQGSVDFFWVIYRVGTPDPGTVQMKFGHA